MWGRSFLYAGAVAFALQLASSLAGRAAARPQPQPAPPAPAPAVTRAPQDAELDLLDQAVASLEECRTLVREPGVSRVQAAGWSGRVGVDLLAKLRDRLSRGGKRSAVVRANAYELIAHAGRLADRGLKARDAAVQQTHLDDALRVCREARELLEVGA